jgi:hypothetical protein
VGPQFEFHRPVGLRWQFDASTGALFPSKDPARGFRLISLAAANWIVADRWLASATLFHERIESHGPVLNDPVNTSSVISQLSLSWYLEDHLRLSLAGLEEQFHYERFYRRREISLSLGYRFAGHLENPGLTEPVHIR